jgi:hypothetical protein
MVPATALTSPVIGPVIAPVTAIQPSLLDTRFRPADLAR